jgi:hypothetical protein
VKNIAVLVLVASLNFSFPLFAASGRNYVGVVAGFAILSGDAQSQIEGSNTAASLYKPETGPTFNLFMGRHLSDYLSLQANYIWNRNDLSFTSVHVISGAQTAYQEGRTSSQQSVIADLLLYFRNRKSWVRPYLSTGAGAIHLSSKQTRITSLVGSAVLPPRAFNSTLAGLRVAVGVDLALRRGWSFRYSFSETISGNPLRDHLSPPGSHSLKNFQNLFGFVKTL